LLGSPRIELSMSFEALRNSRTPLPMALPMLRQLARSEDDQHDHEQDDELRPTDGSHVLGGSSLAVRLMARC